MGKKIRGINRKSLQLLRSYFWPGNIRELQNVIERAVIVSEGDVLWIDESWLSTESNTAEPATGTLSKLPPDREKKIIEAALAETRGRVSGLECAPPTGDFSPRFEGSATGGFGLLNLHLVFHWG
jgi:DNA-binding NtrC family response regulator